MILSRRGLAANWARVSSELEKIHCVTLYLISCRGSRPFLRGLDPSSHFDANPDTTYFMFLSGSLFFTEVLHHMYHQVCRLFQSWFLLTSIGIIQAEISSGCFRSVFIRICIRIREPALRSQCPSKLCESMRIRIRVQ